MNVEYRVLGPLEVRDGVLVVVPAGRGAALVRRSPVTERTGLYSSHDPL